MGPKCTVERITQAASPYVFVTRGLILGADNDLFQTQPFLRAMGARPFTEDKTVGVSGVITRIRVVMKLECLEFIRTYPCRPTTWGNFDICLTKSKNMI